MTSSGVLRPGPLTDGTAAFPYGPPAVGRHGELRYDDVVYSCEPGYRPLFLDLRLPPGNGPHPLIVWVHGGGWLYGSRRRLPPHLHDNAVHDRMLEAGFAVAAVDYRLAREAGFPGMLSDLRAAVRWLRGHAAAFALDPERVVLWGESAGGHLAVMAGLCPTAGPRTGEHPEQSERPTAIVDWYGPTDLAVLAREALVTDADESGPGESDGAPEDVVGVLREGSTWTLDELSPTSYVRADVPPVLVAHGTDDATVPVDQSHRLVAALRAAGAEVEYLEVPGADHVWRGAASVDDITSASLRFARRTVDAAPVPAGPP